MSTLLGAQHRCPSAVLHQQQRSRGHLVVVAANRVRSKKQVACSRTLIAKQGHEVEVAKIAGDILRFTEADSPVKKQIYEYQCVRDGWESNTFHFWERYEDTTAFGAHTTAPRMMELLTQLRPHLEGPMGMSLYSYENGRLGAVSMQAGPKGEGGLDDATGASGAAGGASMKQTSRAFDLTKVNEHEENERDNAMLDAMNDPGTKKAVAVAQPAAAVVGKAVASKAAAEGGKAAEGPRGLPQMTPANMLAMATGVKDAVMGQLCRLFRH